jgi:hypothetical protein
MLFRLILLSFLISSPTVSAAMTASPIPKATNPTITQSINELQSQRTTLENTANELERKASFWHTAVLVTAFLTAAIGLLAFVSQHLETRRVNALSDTTKTVSSLTEKITALQIEHERTARVDLLKQLAPRGLNMTQMGEIRRKLYSQFHTLPIDIVFYSGDYEMAGFASNLNITFAAWHPGMREVYREFSRGITIDYDPNDKVASEASQPFFDALKPYGFRLNGPFPTLSGDVPYLIGGEKATAKLRITVGWRDAPAVPVTDMMN